MRVFTSSWFTELPPEIARIGISRGTPRGQAGFKTMRELAPGPWFRSVPPPEYLRLYDEEVLSRLDPADVVARLEELGEGQDGALLCWENPRDCIATRAWCHRHIVARWLQDHAGVAVEEYGYPGLEPARLLRKAGSRG